MAVSKSNGIEVIVTEVLRVIGSNGTKGSKGYQKAEVRIHDFGNETFHDDGKTKVHATEEIGICGKEKARHEPKLQTFSWVGKVSRKESNMLAYLFRTSGIGEEEWSMDDVAKFGDFVLSLREIQCLSPNVPLSSNVINIWAAYLNENELENWFLPTSFALTANRHNAGPDAKALVALTIRTCRLWRFYKRLNKCSKIFIPIEDQHARHWFLLVMNLVRRSGTLWDSLPDVGGFERRLKLATKSINLLQRVFENDMTRSSDVQYYFPSFELRVGSSNPTHGNTNESDIYVIRHM
ncbi:hypothetical protein ABKV19_027133 [Rosa sericea]